MAINYYPERGSWEAENLSDEEKNSLIEIAKELIINNLGEQLADRIMEHAFPQHSGLADIEPEDMGQA